MIEAQASNGAGVRAERRWVVGDATLDERSLTLEVGNAPIRLERKQLEVLLYLLQHTGDVVTEDELLEAVWPGRIVGDSSLSQAISRIRKAIGDADKKLIVTVHGFGYRLVSSRCEIIARAQPAPSLELAIGDHPPDRPLWSLAERLGIGGHGEAWLVRHDKTREQRVFKFSRDAASLAALKREIMLFRLLRETLGEDAPIVRLSDWNLEQSPCYIEAEYLPGGSLSQWADRIGGLERLPLADRLETMARIAEAVGAIHSAGVVHKDLKPSNVLAERVELGPAAIRIGDLGSGGLLDPDRLRLLNITRLGLTTTISVAGQSGGTPMYLAPEVIEGKPPTVLADVYALGVMLYQFIVADFDRHLTPGWERDVEDELLRDDISFAVQGDPAHRLADAGELARRLRNLGARHQQLREAREAAQRAAKAELALDRAKARRVGLILAFAAMVIGTTVSTTLYVKAHRAQQRAEAETRRAQAVADFIGKGMFAVIDSGDHSVKSLTVKELLDAASKDLDQRFADQPAIAVDIYSSFGKSYLALGYDDQAVAGLDKALELQRGLSGDGAAVTLERASDLISPMYGAGLLPPQIQRFESLLVVGEKALGAADPSVLRLKMELGRHHAAMGHWVRAADELQSAYDTIISQPQASLALKAKCEVALGYVLTDLARFQEAEKILRASIADLTALGGAGELDIGRARLRLGDLLLQLARYPEADSELDAARRTFTDWEHDASWKALAVRNLMARSALEQGDPKRALALVAEARRVDRARLPAGEAGDESVRGVIEAQALMIDRRTTEAERSLREAIRVSSLAIGPTDPWTIGLTIELADQARVRGDAQAAWAILGEVPDEAVKVLPAVHPIPARLLRVKGLLWAAAGDAVRAAPALDRYNKVTEQLYGRAHWRSLRARDEAGLH